MIAEAELNKEGMAILNQVAADLGWGRRQARWRYFGEPGAMGQKPSSLYFWTVEALGKKYASGVYRYSRSKKIWTLTNKRSHAQRKGAKARAWKLYQEAIGPKSAGPIGPGGENGE